MLEGDPKESSIPGLRVSADSLAKRCHSYLKRVWMTPDLDDEALDMNMRWRSMKDKRLKCLISYQGMLARHTLCQVRNRGTFRA